MKLTYRHTLYASYLGYITQAIVNNLTPLLFVIFQRQFGISLEKIGLLISINFGVQILVDLACTKFVDKIGYRKCAVAAHVCGAAGLLTLGLLPGAAGDPYAALVAAAVLGAIGGGLTEVLISPIVESLPGDEKASAMSMLHSFYCWGHMAVVILSTLYFSAFGTDNWRFLPLCWAAVPLFNAFFFAKVPLRALVEEGEEMPVKKFFSLRVFWILLVLMICSGAAEQAMSQWSSLFAELGLGVSKTVGDLLGPCAFALMMGLSRLFFGLRGAKINLKAALMGSSALCIGSYLLAVFSPWPLLSLAGCALCGLSVGVMWPGTISLSAQCFPQGGTALFALLALGGDVGCSSGPGLVGAISGAVQEGALPVLNGLFGGGDMTQVGLKAGLCCALIFPVLLIAGVALLKRRRAQQ